MVVKILMMSVPLGDGKFENIPLDAQKTYSTEWEVKEHTSGHWWSKNRTTTYTNVLKLYSDWDGVIATYPEGESADYVSRYIANLVYS